MKIDIKRINTTNYFASLEGATFEWALMSAVAREAGLDVSQEGVHVKCEILTTPKIKANIEIIVDHEVKG
jgi:hypothetical protein